MLEAAAMVGMARTDEAAALVGVSVKTWRRWNRRGLTPESASPTKGYRGWRRAELLAWIREGMPPRAKWNALVKAHRVTW